MNLSIYAIPVYYILSLVPHSYGLNLIMSTKNGRWDNANPRSPKTQAAAEKSVPAATFARYVGLFFSVVVILHRALSMSSQSCLLDASPSVYFPTFALDRL